MRILLDSHAFLWYSAGDSRLSSDAQSAIESGDNEPLLSTGSLIEIAIKLSLGKLTLSGPFEQFIVEGVAKLRCTVLDTTVAHAGKLSLLPFHHRDPFDRILVAQALVDDIDVVSIDSELDVYGIRRIW